MQQLYFTAALNYITIFDFLAKQRSKNSLQKSNPSFMEEQLCIPTTFHHWLSCRILNWCKSCTGLWISSHFHTQIHKLKIVRIILSVLVAHYLYTIQGVSLTFLTISETMDRLPDCPCPFFLSSVYYIRLSPARTAN